MKAWIKGGLWGIAVGFLLFILFFLAGAYIMNIGCPTKGEGVCEDSFAGNLTLSILTLSILPLVLLGKFGLMYYLFWVIIGVILSVLYWFLIGALIGLIMGKIKGKKSKRGK